MLIQISVICPTAVKQTPDNKYGNLCY